MGTSPATAGYLRFPAATGASTILQLGTVPVMGTASGAFYVGPVSTDVLQLNSGGALGIQTNNGAFLASLSTNALSITNQGATFTIAPTARILAAIPMALTAGAGQGGASSSIAGATLSFAGGAGGVATSGTAAGTAGGPVTVTAGVGAAGLGTNQNGGNGGTLTIGSGAGGAATGSGTAGAAGSIVNQVAGTTVLSMGTNGVGLLMAASSVSITGGTTTLSATQYLLPIIRLTGTLTSADTVVFPNVAGMWFVDIGGLVGLIIFTAKRFLL